MFPVTNLPETKISQYGLRIYVKINRIEKEISLTIQLINKSRAIPTSKCTEYKLNETDKIPAFKGEK